MKRTRPWQIIACTNGTASLTKESGATSLPEHIIVRFPVFLNIPRYRSQRPRKAARRADVGNAPRSAAPSVLVNTELFQENTTDDIISDGVNLSFFDVVYLYRLHTTVGQHSRSPTVANEFPIGLYDLAEADLELFCNSWRAGFFRERL